MRATHQRVEACDVDGEIVYPDQRPPATEVSEAVQLARKVDPKRLYVDVSDVRADLGIGAEDGITASVDCTPTSDCRLTATHHFMALYTYNDDIKSRSLPISKNKHFQPRLKSF